MTSKNFDVAEEVSRSPMHGFHWWLIALCGMCQIMDGFDTQSIGYVAPALMADWHLKAGALGPVFSSGLAGMLVGAVILGSSADRFGRRPVIIVATFIFSIFTLTASKATGLPELMTLRFIAGLGLGAVIPNTMALVGEYAPTKIRVTLMMLTSCGFTAGAAVGGFVSAAIMPRWGWQSVMYVGGAVPFVLAILMIFALPESVQFRAVKNHEPERIRRLLLSVNPLMKIAADASFKTSGPTSASASQLFSDGRATGTLLLWILNFVNMLTLF